LRILSASGDNRQKWMATHVRVGEKNAITLWAMPETKEVTSEMFATTDIAVKQMPMSPWAIVIPFVSSTDGGNALYAWDSQDVLSVDENEMHDASISPLPATDYINIAAQGMEGNVRYAVTSVDGQTLLAGNSSMYDGACRLEVNTLPAGVYVCTLKTENAFTTTRFIKQ